MFAGFSLGYWINKKLYFNTAFLLDKMQHACNSILHLIIAKQPIATNQLAMSYHKCEEPAADLVMNLFISNREARHSYHNLLQTIKVVNHTKEIAAFYQLDETELCILLMAAWFHDVGYLYDERVPPEQRSIMILTGFLQTQGAGADQVERACQCIAAIKTGPLLSSLTERIICDAVTYDYGTAYFRETSFCPPSDWIELLKNHIYYTEYCQLKLHSGKLENIGWLRAVQ